MTIAEFTAKLKNDPTTIQFTDTMAVIEENYTFRPTAFKNGTLLNETGQNSGSCKLFAFALQQGFTEEDTLACFGQYYFDEVLNDMHGLSHQNIRNFMKTGFKGIVFTEEALIIK